MVSGGSASPAPAPSAMSASAASGSRQARTASPVIRATRPITPIWLPISARVASAARPSSAANDSLIVNGHTGAS